MFQFESASVLIRQSVQNRTVQYDSFTIMAAATELSRGAIGDRETSCAPGHWQDGNSIMTDVEKRIERLERLAAEAVVLAGLAGEPSTRTYNTKFAEDLLGLAQTLRAARDAGLATQVVSLSSVTF